MPALWYQRRLSLPPHSQGIYSITREIVAALPEIGQITTGLLNLFLQHTSASLTINENADPDVLDDLETGLDHVASEKLPYRHTLEGRDDMPAHLKSSFFGVSLNIPVGNGRLLLGTWQGIYLCEHRLSRHTRQIVLTLNGISDS